MIFVLDEANVLYVAGSEAELQGAFEGVDVEDGAYRFFDESGNPLVVEFTEHNRRGRILGLVPWVRSGKYRLLPNDIVIAPHLSEILNKAIAVEPNRYFSDIEAVRRALCR
jgi:hypothetical protein